jgi:hypothetical protein
MQRGCNNINTTKRRKLDHFSDFSIASILRTWAGAKEDYSGNVKYWSSFVPGSSARSWRDVPFYLPRYRERTQMEWNNGSTTPRATRYNHEKDTYETILRPPSWVTAPSAAPAGSVYDQYWDFKYPIARNQPVITLFGTFNVNDTNTTSILFAGRMKGNVKMLLDLSDPVTFANAKGSISGDTFWWGRNMHLRITYKSGKASYVAYGTDAQPMHNTFIFWAVNLPDVDGDIDTVAVLYRPMCVRYGSMAEPCNLNHASNAAVTAANFYDTAVEYLLWTAPAMPAA